MNTATQRTPGPWSVEESTASYFYIIAPSEDWNAVASTWPQQNQEEQQANAAFIVKACNAHDELLTALQLYAEGASDFGTRARAALAKLS